MATAVKEAPKTKTFTPQGEYQLAPIGHIVVDKGFNNRRSLGDIAELTLSIQSRGVLQPLLVWKRELGLQSDPTVKGNGFLHVIAGHRRFAAALEAGLTHVPVIVVDQDEQARLESLLVENLHRLDIDPLEEAAGYKRLIDLGNKQAEIAAKVGRSEAHVSKRLALVSLVPAAVQLVVSGGISLDKAIDLAKVKPELQAAVLHHEKTHQSNYGGKELFRYASPASVAKKITEKQEKDSRRKVGRAQAKKEGVTLIKGFGNGFYHSFYGRVERPLGSGKEHIHVGLKEHRALPCHRAFIDDEGRLKYACADPSSHMTKAEAQAFKRKANPEDSYEKQRQERKARQEKLRAIATARDAVVAAAIGKLDPASGRKLALESLVILHSWTADLPSLKTVLGESADKKFDLADYCNKSEANLLRAAVAISYLVAAKALDNEQTYNASGSQYLAAADWLESIGYESSDIERSFRARVKKELKVK